MKTHTWQKTLRCEEPDGANIEIVCEYKDIPVAVQIRDWVLEGLYRELEKLEICDARDEERSKAMLRGIRIIKQRRDKLERLLAGESNVCA